jgi:hypothetical protein
MLGASPMGDDNLDVLRARGQEVEREWQWLHDALNAVARTRAEQGEVVAFRLMQQQAVRVGQRRVELRMKLAELERAGNRRRQEQCPPRK